uniref:Sulfotransferase n=1 Tax=Oryza punctata TaxID=4537 RepID=A0A0E0MFP2_ORYPU
MATSSNFMDMAKLAPTLPLERRCPPFPLRQFRGFWMPEGLFPALETIHSRFQTRPSDIFLACFPKSGTTWLKALGFATVNRREHPPSGEDHPLRLHGPHDCVKFFEPSIAAAGGSEDVFAAFPSPRLLSTHIPYSLLPEHITADSSGCRIVYVCRDPKDTLVSSWLFSKKASAAGNVELLKPASYTINEALELFCDGRCVTGPQWRHVVEYWEESQRRPEKVLFLRYEDMLREPARNVKKLADFIGYPFSGEEEAAGVVDAIVELCSFDHLRSLEVNKTGVLEVGFTIGNKSFFRKGVAGDWINYISPEMAAKLDGVVGEALRGSGFRFDAVGDST